MPECPICLLPFNTSDHVPMLLSCEHSLCLTCAKNLTIPLSCPLCRRITSGSVLTLKRNPKLFPKQDLCGECKSEASSYCASCGPLCKPCSSKMHAFKAFSSHVVVPVNAKASVIPYCEEHDKEADLYCPADSSIICTDCKDSGTHKGHANIMSLQEAALHKTGELQGIIGRVNAAMKLNDLAAAVTQAREDATKKFTAARIHVEAEFAMRKQKILKEIDKEEQKLNAAFQQQLLELNGVSSRILDLKTQALKVVCGGNKPHQILQAPKVEFPRLDVLDGPCFVLRKYCLVLPDISQMKVDFHSDASTRRVFVEDVVAQRDLSKVKRLDVLDIRSSHDAWRTAAILKMEGDKCLIHYEGWGSQWISVNSFRCAPIGKHTRGMSTGDPTTATIPQNAFAGSKFVYR